MTNGSGLCIAACAVLVACSGANPSDVGFGSATGSDTSGGSGSSTGSTSSGAGSSTSSSSSSGGGTTTGGGSSGTGTSSGAGTSSGTGASSGVSVDAGGTTPDTTIYAHTDDTLYTLDPMTMTPTEVGAFAGLGGGDGDTAVTDLAVDGKGDVYVNSETVLYQVALPTGGTGTVNITRVAKLGGGASFYALAYAPVGALDDAEEALVGGDSKGTLWSIDAATGDAFALGDFGPDPVEDGNVLGLSGDVVFYTSTNGAPLGLATIRSCPPKGGTCGKDYLASIDMAAIKTAYSTKTAATSLLGGVYGSPAAGQLGNGTGFYGVYGLGAWNAQVFGFTRNRASLGPQLITIDTTTGAGTAAAPPFAFTNGWSGAGVTTKVAIIIRPPMIP